MAPVEVCQTKDCPYLSFCLRDGILPNGANLFRVWLYQSIFQYVSKYFSNQFQTSKQTQDGCYTCGQFSHKWRQCPNNKSVKVSYFVHDLSHIDRINNYQNNFLMKVFLNDGVCLNALN